ncbi:MAG: type II secretion system protein [Lysinibacillus sp.]
MRKRYSNNRGMTLIEVLATVVILGIVFSLIFNILISSNDNQIKQTQNNQELNDVTYVLKQVTKDMRKSTSYDKNTQTFIGPSQYKYLFDPDTNTLQRNNELLSSIIEEFSLTPLNNSKTIIVVIKSTNGHTVSTKLTFRSGG